MRQPTISPRSQAGSRRALLKTLDGECDIFNKTPGEPTDFGDGEGYPNDPQHPRVRCHVEPMPAVDVADAIRREDTRYVRISIPPDPAIVVTQTSKIRVWLFDDRGNPRLTDPDDDDTQMFEEYLVDDAPEDRTALSLDRQVIASQGNQS